LSYITDTVKWNGQDVAAGPLLESQLGILANQYAHAQDLGQLDRAAQAHMSKIFENPTKTLLSVEDARAQILNARKFIQNELIKNTNNRGFIPQFVIKEMEAKNSPMFDKLNNRKDREEVQQLKKESAQNEMKYAK